MRRMISVMSDKELRLTLDAIVREQALRRKLDASPEKIEHAIAEYQKATGRGEGEQWEQPTGALNAYRKGAVVEHEGEEWVSTTPNNVWEPGQSGWRLRPLIDPETGEEIPPPYVPPTGAHDSYQAGERVTFEGEVYAAARDGVAHSPAEYPADWKHVIPATPIEPAPEPEPEPEEPPEEGEPDPEEPDPEEPTDPEETEPEPVPEPEPGTIDNPFAWEAGVDYEADHYVTYNGAPYRVVQAHTSAAHWTPDQAASLYERQE